MATSTDDIALLFRIRADAAQVKTATTEAKAAVAQLRQSFGPELAQTVSLSNKTFSDLAGNLSQFVGQRIPLVGGAFVRLTDNIKGMGAVSAGSEKALASVGRSIESIATASGKTVPQIASFLTNFVKLETQAKRDESAISFFGASMATKLLPSLEKAGTGLATVAGAAEGTGAAMAGLAGPIGIAVLAIGALVVGVALVSKEIFTLSKNAAEFQGRMFDLAQQTGLAVSTLSAFEVLARRTGGELGTIVQAVVLFERKLADAQDPLSKTAEQFRKFGVDTADTESALRSAFAALAAMPEGFEQTNAAAELFGARGGKQFLAILKETGGDLDATIKRLREMGILISEDAARAADIFNDELVTLELQLRALSAAAPEDLIPVMVEIIRALGDVVTAIRPVVSALSSIAGTALRPVAHAFKGLSAIVQVLTLDYKGLTKAIKEANEAGNIPALKVPELSPVPLPGQPSQRQIASDAVSEADAIVAAVRRSVASQNQALDSLFQQGRRTREQQGNEIIASNKRILDAEVAQIDARLAQKEQEIKALDEAQRKRGEIVTRDTDAFRAAATEIAKLQQQRLDKENEFAVSSRAIQSKIAKERADAIRNQIRNESDLLVNEFDRQIKATEARIKQGGVAEADGLAIIESLEQAKIDARLESLQKQRDIGFLSVQDQKDIDAELQKLNQEKDRLADEQAARRIDREQATANRIREIQLAEIDTLLELQQIRGARTIEAIQANADARVITEENAAKKILAIRLQLIDDEIETTKAKLESTKDIVDVNERTSARAELNNRIKILTDQRVSIEAQGARDVDDARQKDLENEERFAAELLRIKQRIQDIQREAARFVVESLALRGASRNRVARAQLEFDKQDEADRHAQALQALNAQRRDIVESNRTQQEKAEALEALHRLIEAENDRHENESRLHILRMINSRAFTRAQILEQIQLDAGVEEKRHKKVAEDLKKEQEDLDKSTEIGEERLRRQKDLNRRIEEENQRHADAKAKQKDDEETAEIKTGSLEDFGIDTDAIEDFATSLEESIVPLNEILASSFFQVADAIGQTVSNWILLGETGPAVMRKILAQALASIAAEASINAVKELALGFATLFFNPAESAGHFISAGLWASIAGASAIGGRALAGDLFKPKKQESSGGSSGRGSSSRSGERDPIDLTRTQMQPQVVIVHLVTEEGLTVKHIERNVSNNGSLRDLIVDVAGS